MLEVVLLKIKKCGFLLSLVMLICFALPSFASANSYRNAIKSGEDLILVQHPSYGTKVPVNDAYTTIAPKGVVFVIDLGESIDLNSIKLNTFNNGRYRGSEIRFFDSQGKMILGYDLAELKYFDTEFQKLANTVKGVRYVKFTHDSPTNDGFLFYEFVVSEVSKGKTGTFPPKGSNAVLPNNTTLDNEIENLKVVEGVNDVTFTWKNPSVSEFSGVKIFNGNLLVATLKKGDTSYKVDGLKENTNYNFKFVSMFGERMSLGIQKEVKTKPKPKEPMPLVKPPENVFLTPQNGKMVITWDDVKSPYLEGYNVYIDGKKINDKPLNSNKMILKNLENGKSYKVQISVVNKENAEGEKSKEKEEKPSSDALEVEYDVKVPFSPLDLLTSSVSLLVILGGFVLLSIVIIWFKPLKELIVKAVRREKDKK